MYQNPQKLCKTKPLVNPFISYICCNFFLRTMSNVACISSPYLYTADDIFPSMICAISPGTVYPFECKVALYVQIMKKLCSTKQGKWILSGKMFLICGLHSKQWLGESFMIQPGAQNLLTLCKHLINLSLVSTRFPPKSYPLWVSSELSFLQHFTAHSLF